MARNITILLTILLLTVGSILYVQWDSYTNHKNELKAEAPTNATEDISLQTDKNGNFVITQTFSLLKKNVEYRVNEAKGALQWGCLQKNGGSCASNDKDPKTFLADKGELVIQSVIKGKKNQPVFLMSDWLGVLPQVRIIRTRLKLVDSYYRGGTWVAGIPLIGSKRMKFIDYYVFEGNNTYFSLYWQKKALYAVRSNSLFSYYSENPFDNWNVSPVMLAQLKDPPYLAIVHTSLHSTARYSGLLVENGGMSGEILEKALLENNLQQKVESGVEESRWLIELLTSIYLKKPLHDSKAITIYAELKTAYTDAELSDFVGRILQSKQAMDVEAVDRLLGGMHGLGTHYFSSIQHQRDKKIRLSFYDVRKVQINGSQNSRIERIVIGSQKYFPFLLTMKELGYSSSATNKEGGFVFTKGVNRYEFTANGLIFKKNNEQFGMLQNPFITVNDVLYINQIGLQTIFSLKIEESDKEIRLVEQ